MGGDIFDLNMNTYFDSECGAYTAFTGAELEKGTYNVKVAIRNILIDKLGSDKIPRVNESEDQTIAFNLCTKIKGETSQTLHIPCKYSKKGKNEVSIYFNRDITNTFHASIGDVWYIYFKKSNANPYFGIMSRERWYSYFTSPSDNNVAEDFDNTSLDYKDSDEDFEKYTIKRSDVPVKKCIEKSYNTSLIASMTPEVAASKEKKRKSIGNRGEKIAIEIEKRRLRDLGREDLLHLIDYVAESKDGAGYDIISVDIDEFGKQTERFIEVKTTTGDKNTPFFVTENEVRVSEDIENRGNAYYIYRIYNLSKTKNRMDYYEVRGSIAQNFFLEVVNYRAIPMEK